MNNNTLLITSEHGGNKVPEKYTDLFNNHSNLLNTHRGLDFGTWNLAHYLEKKTSIPVKLFGTEITRLLVDVNRSLWRRTLFSEITKSLSKADKEIILEKYYYAYRNPIYDFVKDEIGKGRNIIHIAVHSFTPILKGIERNTDIGLLYNPERVNEKVFSKRLKTELINNPLKWRVRFNYPYRGKPDGFTAHFRKLYPDDKYLGIEYEVNQKYATKNNQFPKHISDFLVNTLSTTITKFKWH